MATLLEIPSQPFLCVAAELTIPEIPAFAMAQLGPLYDAADAQKLSVVGPPVFFYHGADGNPATRFRLEIGLPLRESSGAPASPYFLATPMKFKCLSMQHKGSLATIGEAWKALVGEAGTMGLSPSAEGREVYHVFQEPTAAINITELQLGVS